MPSPSPDALILAALRRAGADAVRRRPWSLSLEDRVLLVAVYWRTNLTLRQLGPLFGVSKSAADHIIDHLGQCVTTQWPSCRRTTGVHQPPGRH
jgi:hypothetical protein